MANRTLYLPVDGIYEAQHLAQPWGDVVGQGVVPAAGFSALQVSALTPASMGIQVERGSCWITNDHATADERGGAWRSWLDAIQLPVDAADPTNPRIDRVIAEVLDTAFGGASNIGRLRVVKGTPAASPAAPAEPVNAITLALVAVAAGATTISAGNITDSRANATHGGRFGVVPTQAAIDALDTRLDVIEAKQWCALVRSGNITVPDNAATWTAVPMTAEDADPFNMHAGSDAHITIPAAGQWLLAASCTYAAPSTTAGRCAIRLATGGVMWCGQKVFISGAGGSGIEMNCSGVFGLTAGQQVQVEVNQNSQTGFVASAFRFTATRLT